MSESAARELGAQHGAAGAMPYGDVDDDGSALLMDALGETGPTTQANHFARLAMVDAYTEAWEQASGRNYADALAGD